jgi:DnaJ domain
MATVGRFLWRGLIYALLAGSAIATVAAFYFALFRQPRLFIVALVLLGICWLLWKCLEEEPSPSDPSRQSHTRPRSEPPPRSSASPPLTELGLNTNATDDEIKNAYRQKIAQYHPDKVSHLGEEFRHLATEHAQRINEAYAELRRQRGF